MTHFAFTLPGTCPEPGLTPEQVQWAKGQPWFAATLRQDGRAGVVAQVTRRSTDEHGHPVEVPEQTTIFSYDTLARFQGWFINRPIRGTTE